MYGLIIWKGNKNLLKRRASRALSPASPLSNLAPGDLLEWRDLGLPPRRLWLPLVIAMMVVTGCRVDVAEKYEYTFSAEPRHAGSLAEQDRFPFSATHSSSLRARSHFVRDDGTLITWGGYNCIPEDLRDVAAVASGFGSHQLALKRDGTVVAWDCQLNQVNIQPTPEALSDVIAIAKGPRRNLAVTREGNVVVWGDLRQGQHVPPEGLSDVVAVAAGEIHNLALKSDGTVVSWGVSQDPVRIDGKAFGSEAKRVPPDLRDVVAIAAGSYHSLAILANGSVAAWGHRRSQLAQLPEGLTDDFGAIAIAAGKDYSAVLLADGSVKHWGYYGAVEQFSTDLQDIVNLAAGPQHFIAVAADGEFFVQGHSGNGFCPECLSPSDLQNVQDISADFGLILKQDGSLVSRLGSFGLTTTDLLDVASIASPHRGRYYYVILNDGTLIGEGEDLTFGNAGFGRANRVMHDIKQAATQNYASIAVRSDGSAVVWGDNFWNDNFWNIDEARDFASTLSDITAVAMHSYFLALTGAGKVIAWGPEGAQSSGLLDVPQDLQDVTAIAAGGAFAMALQSDGTVRLWGPGANDEDPALENLTDIVAIAAGIEHGLALRSDGEVLSWGQAIAPPEHLGNVVSIRAIPSGGIAIREDGTVVSWGQMNIPPAFYDIATLNRP